MANRLPGEHFLPGDIAATLARRFLQEQGRAEVLGLPDVPAKRVSAASARVLNTEPRAATKFLRKVEQGFKDFGNSVSSRTRAIVNRASNALANFFSNAQNTDAATNALLNKGVGRAL